MNIKNIYRYLSASIVQDCFIKGKVTSVDKQTCGNGFSTSFLNLPIPNNKINIIIAPNKAVVISKQQDYVANPDKYNNRIKFFYKESKDIDFLNADVLFFVADSFLQNKQIDGILHKIDKVLIDENHSVEQQSLFRWNLKDFEYKVKNKLYFDAISIVKVTASPTHFSKVDISIANDLIKPISITRTSNIENALERIKIDLKAKENVVVASNNAGLISRLKNRKNIIDANFIIGDGLMRSMVELATINQNVESNLTIVSSRGFEGFDIDYTNAKVYFFENRNFEHESFYISNLYQAINRTRSGASYIEYCRIEINNQRKEIFKDIDNDILNFVSPDFTFKGIVQSTENKHKTEFKKYQPYVIFNQDSRGGFSIKPNQVAIDLYKETRLYDKPFPSIEFESFLNSRKITINDIRETQKGITSKVKESTKIGNLKNNKAFISQKDLFGTDYTIDVRNAYNHSIKDVKTYRLIYLKELNKYLRRKNYNSAYIQSEQEKLVLSLLSSEAKFNTLLNKVTEAFDLRSIKKYGKEPSLEYRQEFKKTSYNIVALFLLSLANKKIYFSPNWVANRDYNLTTKIGINEINIISKAVGLNALELDAKSCFPRIVYALCGKSLPAGFYGKDKKNKVKINVLLNNFFYNKELKREKKFQKMDALNHLRYYNFDADVIEYLMNNYFDIDFRGSLFNKLAFHEKKIISEVKDRLIDYENKGVVRRHDSVLIFDNENDLSFLNDMVFLNKKGWFNSRKDEVIRPSIPYYSILGDAPKYF